MTSKHYRWQTRWRHDAAAGLWVHATGLQVRCPPGVAPQLVNGPETLAVLLPTHGPHNAPSMLQRLAREAQQLASGSPTTQGTP
jgi:hypothetical protein